MPGIGWTELLLVAAVAIIVVGPKDLPILMRTIGRFLGKARALAREFQESFEEIAREAELEELREENEKLRNATMVSGPATPLSVTAEEELRAKTNAEAMAAEQKQSEMTPLEPGGAAAQSEASNVTPLRGGATR